MPYNPFQDEELKNQSVRDIAAFLKADDPEMADVDLDELTTFGEEERRNADWQQGFFGDFIDSAQQGFTSMIRGDLETINMLADDQYSRAGADKIKQFEEENQAGMSTMAQEAMGKEFISDTEDGGWEFGDAWADPRAYSNIIASGFGSLAGMFTTGGPLKKGASWLLKKGFSNTAEQLFESGVAKTKKEAAEMAAKQLKNIDRTAAATGYGIAEGSAIGGLTGADIGEAYDQMDNELKAQAPLFQGIYHENKAENPDMSHEELFVKSDAELRDSLRKEGAVMAGLPSAALGAVFGPYMEKLIFGGAKSASRTRAFGKGAVAEGIPEAGQGGIEQYAQNVTLGQIDPTIDPMSGVANAAVMEGIGGMGAGAPMAAITADIQKAQSVDDALAAANAGAGSVAAKAAEQSARNQAAAINNIVGNPDAGMDTAIPDAGTPFTQPLPTDAQINELAATPEVIEGTRELTGNAAVGPVEEGAVTGEPQSALEARRAERQNQRLKAELQQRMALDEKASPEAKAERQAALEKWNDEVTIDENLKNVPINPQMAKALESQGLITKQQAADANIRFAASEAATSTENDLNEPSDAQKSAGNYKLGKTRVNGLDISIENPQGSERSGTDPGGQKWSQTMTHHYGYIKGTVGKDKDHVDVFMGPKASDPAGTVFVVDQVVPGSNKFDEHKVMMGFDSEQEAVDAYLSNYQDGWQGLGSITAMPIEEFKVWVKNPVNTSRKASLRRFKGGPSESMQSMRDNVEKQKQTEETTEGAPATEVGLKFSPRGRSKLGAFEAKEGNDGTLTVYGDPEDIRSNLPDGVRGRPTKDGLVFGHNAAPRVKGALSGKGIGYSRQGQVLKRKPMKDGNYLGAPKIYNTRAKIGKLRRILKSLTLEGERGRFWYENSSKEILRVTNGDVNEARKLVALMSIYSPQAKVDTNTTFALRAWSQYKAGQPISVKTKVQDDKAKNALDNVDEFWSGEKTGNFFFNLLSEIDPSTKGNQGATIDMWMMRAGHYDHDAPTPSEYAFMEDETNRIAKDLGWEPQQVQAAIWVAMKARMENKGVKKRTEEISEKKGWISFKKEGKKKVRVVHDKEKHYDNWIRQAFKHTPTKEDTGAAKFDFADGMARHIGQVSWEPRISTKLPFMPGIHEAPYEQQLEYFQAVQKALYDTNGNDILGLELGLLSESIFTAPGVWEGDVSPSGQVRVVMPPEKGNFVYTKGEETLSAEEHKALPKTEKANWIKTPVIDPTQKELLDVYSAVLGLVLRQDGVGYHRPFYNGNKSSNNGVELQIGKPFTNEQIKLYEAELGAILKVYSNKWADQIAIISSPEGVRVVNLGLVSDQKKFREHVEKAAEALPDNLTVDPGYFYSDGNLVSNDWEVDTNGEGYKRTISESGRPDILGWARTHLIPKIQRINREFSEKFGWGDPGRIKFSASQEQRLSDGRVATVDGRSTAATKKLDESLGFESGTVKEIPVDHKTALGKFIKNFVEGVLGKKVIVVSGPVRFDGVMYDNDATTIYLNEASTKPHMAVLGHEILHTVRTEFPALYEELRVALEPLIMEHPLYTEMVIKGRQVNNQQDPVTEEFVIEEIIADLLGDGFLDQEFWARVQTSQPALFERILTAIKNYLDGVVDLLIGRQMEGTQYFKDYKKARDLAAQAFSDYVSLKQGKPAAGITITEELVVTETGETVTVEDNAASLLRDYNDRMVALRQIQRCMAA